MNASPENVGRQARWRWLRAPGAVRRRPDRAGSVAGVLLSAVVLQACIVVPQTRERYDPECRVLTRHVTLEAAALGQFHACQGRGCEMLLVSAGVVTAASAVVSGSIALVGNAVYWIERQGRCLAKDRPPLPAAAASAPAAAASPRI